MTRRPFQLPVILASLLAFFCCSIPCTFVGAQGVFITNWEIRDLDTDQADEDQDDEDDDDEFEDEQKFMNNPWRIDERKLFAAKTFQIKTQFAMKIKRIDDLCGLDKKQKLKLKVASKGAVEQGVDKYVKDWRQYIKQFGNQNFGVINNGGKKKKTKKKRKEEFVVNNVDQIDAQVFQMLDQSIFAGGVQVQDHTDVALWKRTVKKVLSKDQQKKLNDSIKQAKLAKQNARADSFIADMQLKLALSDEQLEEFSKLVRPAFLKKHLEVSWTYEAMATLYLGSKYDKKKMKKLLSKEQELVLRFATKPAENYAGMFGDNNVRVMAAQGQFNPVEQFFEEMFQALDGFAMMLERTFSGVGNWKW